jgi:hypothetical protein
MNRLLATTATLAALATAAVAAPTQANAGPAPAPSRTTAAPAPATAPADVPCYRINHRVKSETSIDLFACYGLPGANGRVGYIAQITNAWGGEVVVMRYRGGAELSDSRRTAPSDGSLAATPYYWGGSPTELQACAYTRYDGFVCAWTANDVG